MTGIFDYELGYYHPQSTDDACASLEPLLHNKRLDVWRSAHTQHKAFNSQTLDYLGDTPSTNRYKSIATRILRIATQLSQHPRFDLQLIFGTEPHHESAACPHLGAQPYL